MDHHRRGVPGARLRRPWVAAELVALREALGARAFSARWLPGCACGPASRPLRWRSRPSRSGGTDWTAFYDRGPRWIPSCAPCCSSVWRPSDLDADAKQVIDARLRRRRAARHRHAPAVWLRSVTVEGFRGIGAPATLTLEPSPGLTVVVGRNGSGKSSFAEGLELLMTGRLKRWEKRPKAWTETWQCLHHDGPTKLSAELAIEGSAEAASAEPGVGQGRKPRRRDRPRGRRGAARRPTAGTARCPRSGPSSPTPSWRRCSTRSPRCMRR